MKTVFYVTALAMITCASVARADVAPPQTEVTISGTEATKIANLMINNWKTTDSDWKGTSAQGKAKVSCVRKQNEANFTCVVKVVNDKQ